VQTAWDHIRLAAERTPEKLAIIDDLTDRAFNYKQLIQEIETVAAGFMEAGISSGQRTATVLPNMLEHAIAILALHRLGTEVCLINPRLKHEEIGALLEDAGVSTVVCLPDAEIVTAAQKAVPSGMPIYTPTNTIEGSTDFALCRGSRDTVPPWERPTAEATAFILYTSGTTGLPKGVMIPHRATDPRVLYAVVQCGLRHGSHNRALGLMPLFHAVGFYSAFLTTLSLNGTYFVHSTFDPRVALNIIYSQNITFLYGAPAHFHALLAAENFEVHSVSSVENLVYAGAAMPGTLLDQVTSSFTNALICNIYGTTEVMNSLYMPDPAGKPFTLRPGFYSNVRVGRIGGAIDELCAEEEEGELLVDASADASFVGYLNRPEVTVEKLVSGWYRTGDIVVQRRDGEFELRGRVDDMIVSGGENIHPEEVETILMQYSGVKDTAVLGISDDRWSERVVACVVVDDDKITSEALDGWCRSSSLANYKRPREYIFLDVLPRNAANKILRSKLKNTLSVQNSE